MKKRKVALLLPMIIVACLASCSSSAIYYKVDKLASADGLKIIDQLEQAQGLEYQENATETTKYLWAGIPKDSVEPNDGVIVHFEGEDGHSDLSREDLSAGVGIGKVSVFWTGEQLNQWSDASSRVDEIARKCGLGDLLREGFDETFGAWYKVGKCKMHDKDAYWGIALYKDGHVYVAARLLGDTSYEELAERGIHAPMLM